MEDEQDDVKKITDFINQQKANYQSNFQWEFQDFVSFKLDISDHEIDEEDLQEEEEEEEIIDVKDFNIAETPTEVAATALTEEERSVIESCTDPDLQKLLTLNRSKNMQLVNLHKKMQDLLTQCEHELQEKQQILKNLQSKQVNQPTFIWKLAAPYFKDKKFFSCPLNEDTATKRAREELTVYDIVPPPKWTPIEFDRLINAIRCNYNSNRQSDIVKKINALKAESSENSVDDKAIVEEIVELERQLDIVKNDESIPPRDSNDFINWYKVAETFLKDKHTASECQSVWHMLVHPDINKSEWTDEENKNLEAIAKNHSYQNWDDIAAELDTQRTGFITCLHYFSKLCDKFKKSKFTPEEDKFLLEVVESYRRGSFIPWNKVVCHFTNRSRHQLYHRYTYFLSQNHVKKGKFTEAEDILLMVLVDRFGRNFKKCAEYMPHRSQVQLKSRYNSNLQRHIRKGAFTREDDQTIFDHVKEHGEKSWAGLTEKLNRCSAQIRQRYKIIKSFLTTNPDASLTDIPKRRHWSDKMSDDQYSFLKYMVDQYRDVDYIPTLNMIEESLQVELRTPTPAKASTSRSNNAAIIKKKVSVKNIDSMLVDFFSSSMKLQQNTSDDASEVNIVEASNNAEEMLAALGADLSIPEDFECIPQLDSIDVEILERISNKKPANSKFKVDKLVSPNISTLVGLRGLIIKHKDYKIQQKSQNFPSASKADKLACPIEQNLLKLDEETRKDVLFHRDLFTKRFNALFTWSAILSLEKPNRIDVPGDSNPILEKRHHMGAPEDLNPNRVLENLNRTDIPEDPTPSLVLTPPARSYRRKSSEQSVNPKVKRIKVDVAALTDLSRASVTNGQLRLVDRSVVERLIQNKNNLNIIRIETCKGSDGIVRPVLPQSNSTVAYESPVNECVATPIDEESEDGLIEDVVVEDEDLEDVQKLNVVLKSEVLNEAAVYNSEEYKAIKGDMQLLKEILHYEKIRVKSEPVDF